MIYLVEANVPSEPTEQAPNQKDRRQNFKSV